MSSLTRRLFDVDVTRPTTPAGVSATAISATRIDLAWSASTDPAGGSNQAVSGVTGYRVYRDNVLRASPTGLSYSDTGLTEYTQYAYQMAAVDGAGNESIRSTAINRRTLDATAPTAPVISAVATSSSAVTVSRTTASTDAGSGVASYALERKPSSGSTWTVLSSNATLPYADSGLSASTAYDYRARATDGSGNVGAYSATSSATTQAPAAAWTAFTGPTFLQGTASNWSFAAFAPVGSTNYRVASGTLPSGVTLDSTNKRLVYDGVGAAATATGIVLEDVPSAVADWQSRISGSGVVWYHGFETDNEVNAFRWTPAFGSGNDPQATGSSLAPLVRRITTDGSDKGTGVSCLEIVRPAGANDGSVWWRPFSPIQGGTTTGNGRGAGRNDPGANGTITPKAYTATSGGNQIAQWNGGAYSAEPRATGSLYDGQEYYLQARVKIDPNRIAGANGDIDVGKLFYFTRTDRSATDQEIVVYSGHKTGSNNYFSMYRSVGPPLWGDPPGVAVAGDQPGTQFGTVGDGVCRLDNSGGRLANCWFWPPNEWVTLLWRIRNGTMTGSLGSNTARSDTIIEVWAARFGQTSYTKIWSQLNVPLPFDVLWGHNALICSIYHNGENMPIQFYHRYDQLIFSKNFIPCPQAW